ncbi:MAG TPA: hypothetical protein VMS21_16160 [Methylomirabilota bacterium]|nr:hypothetical protein [Methylomirabilota bacterium]
MVLATMSEIKITFRVSRDEETGSLVASWDDPSGGGITTQAEDLKGLEAAVREAMACHFEPGKGPRTAALHFTEDPELSMA